MFTLNALLEFFGLFGRDSFNCYLYCCVCRHMDTSLIDVDVQPTYVRVTLKGKVRICKMSVCMTQAIT